MEDSGLSEPCCETSHFVSGQCCRCQWTSWPLKIKVPGFIATSVTSHPKTHGYTPRKLENTWIPGGRTRVRYAARVSFCFTQFVTEHQKLAVVM